MSEILETTEAVVSAEPVAPAAEEEVEKYDFDADFQTKVAALVCRDGRFLRQVSHLIRPQYFESVGEAALVKLGLDFFEKEGTAMSDMTVAWKVVQDAVKTKVIRASDLPAVKDAFRVFYSKTMDLSAPDFVVKHTAAFARNAAMAAALLQSVDELRKGDHAKIDKLIRDAQAIGPRKEDEGYDFFAKAQARAEIRMDRASGKSPPRGITTGCRELDDVLYHKGWGRKELSLLLGGAKAGKTTALLNFALAASLASYNVLYATLEVGSDIVSDRLDAALTATPMKSLNSSIIDVRDKVLATGAKTGTGALKIHEYASGTLRPSELEALIEKYATAGLKFDLVVVDYADLMAPERRVDNVIENFRTIYIDLRGLAFKFDLAMLTATQTNREGFKSTVAKAEHVAEDFNKVRTVDIMLSISKTEEEAARGEARLYFAASRNTESGFSLKIKQDIARMKFIEKVLGRE